MGFLSSIFKGKTSTFDPMSAFTGDQRQSLSILSQLANTGSGGGINLGQAYGGDLGYFEQTPGELQALQQLQALSTGQALTGAKQTFTDFTNNKFNPDDPSSGYAAFSRALAKAGQESSDVLDREAAITGSRFGTGIQAQKGDLAADLANQRGMFLADLFNQGENRKMQGAQGLLSTVGTEAELALQLAQQAEVGRLLKDAKARAELDDFRRVQNENLQRIGLLGSTTQTPLAPITTKSPSLFQQLLPSLIPMAGSALSSGTSLLSGLFKGGGSASTLSQQVSAFGGGARSYTAPTPSFSNILSIPGLKF